MNSDSSSFEYCGKGIQLRSELGRLESDIFDIQSRMEDAKQAENAFGRVPRTMQESLTENMNRRAFSRLQWTRHLDRCWTCASAAQSDIAA